MKSCSWIVAGAALLLISGSALADTEYTSQSAFEAAVSGTTTYSVPAPDGGASGQDVGSLYTIGPVTFNAGDIWLYNDGGYGPGQTYIAGVDYGMQATLTGANAVGFNFGSYYGPENVNVYVNGNLIDTLYTNGASDSSFFGYTSSSSINSVSFAPVTEGTSELDVLNFETGAPAPTPEPSSLALLGSALVGGAATLRKRLIRA